MFQRALSASPARASLRSLAVLAIITASTSSAQRAFPFTWDSATQAKGTSDVQLWLSSRSGRLTPFTRTEGRGWVNSGLTGRVDLFYGLELDGQFGARDTKDLDGRISTLIRYRLFEPNEVLGVALLARAGFGAAASVLEARLVLDRRIGTVLLAVNSSFERTIFWDRRDAIETRLEHNAAVRFMVTPEVSAGLEVRARQALQAGAYQGTGVYAGPSVTVTTRWVWFSVGATVQVLSDKAAGDKGNGERLIFRDDERFSLRLVMGLPTK